MEGLAILKTLKYAAYRRYVVFSMVVILICGILFMSGCAGISKKDMRLVSKPNMQFSGSAIFNYQDKLLTQFESSSASFTGGQSGDCGSCVAGGAL
ncbi:MAG: hypothetical protein GX846_01095 [Deltaproteobacteria bacterium]|nr:hypothetical protein [Deltaproteobacteria bacterium]